ncbi:DEAD/DEAH box helicase [Phyllobacterium endophyticum]|uniref:Type III restriction endonuclease subunit R n=1 Tax=Phyllobacterium endophyticum TaxID=1149773 RepID=A0A2P7AZM2_9HYPH|nr:DEAD/DEAH box helicase family protein [Phyllobacterium endophyticum]MBB3235794.1 type III restriction enzyme [Phyllobacterium endophyticum]PSH59604.1 type III restriction endonuclease subunit R [Phyllobacterium endophyticum]TYR41745.1 type III restriction endonuclease subunit R [Phyllobacterium endophyticum]
MRQLAYQDRILDALDTYLDALTLHKVRADRIADMAASEPSLGIEVPDFSALAWDQLRRDNKLPPSRVAIAHSERRDGIGRSVPNAVLKVPTGGGKTYVAINGLSRIFGRYLNSNTGFVLWIVPNEAIYSQTLNRLRDRQDPYRQMLDRAAAGRVRIMEKTDRLDSRDVESQLCVMLLMLQSANRETKDTLKMFQDRGDVSGFTPPQGDQKAHSDMSAAIPNLSLYDLADNPVAWPLIKDSLGNALRIIRPVVVLDEGHRAVSDLAFETLYGFNPSFVLELTATPHDVQPRGGRNPHPGRYANVLVEVTGVELDKEGMIKMPLNLDTRQNSDWKTTLAAAIERLNVLQREAESLRGQTNRYIRPIMLIQVERTGKDQRSAGLIHSEDVKEWLLTAGFDEAEIAIKTAETNDLSAPENQDLLSPFNRVRAIITKQALQEGWDCPFAYVLCSLSANSNLRAMTQLVGRILRQPGALKTGIDPLDECYVITHQAGTAEVVANIKEGLEKDGLGDLVIAVHQGGDSANVKTARLINRRAEFSSQEIYLPKVLVIENGLTRDLDYETDILAAIDWRGFDPTFIADAIPENTQAAARQLQRISIADTPEHFAAETLSIAQEALRFDPAYAVRMISDLVPNPFVAREIVGSLLHVLKTKGFNDAKIGAIASRIVDELRRALDMERAAKAEALFKAAVATGGVQFRLRLDGKNWRLPFSVETTEPLGAPQLHSIAGGSLAKSLFAPIYESELNTDERAVAGYLDNDDALKWWHRNVARKQYGLQGWRRGKIYPDFIFAVQRNEGGDRIAVLETKGDQLDNLDTAYKRDLLNFLSDNFAWDTTVPAGTLELQDTNGETVECALVLMSEWRSKLPGYLA